jgi:adenylate cyclase
MGIEIERKFLLTNNSWKKLATGTIYRQGYLNADKERSVRVRIIDNKAFFTIKGKSVGAARLEFEYEIPLSDAETLLTELCHRPLIHKKRYKIEYAGNIWEIDEFFDENEGLVVAEIELENEDQKFLKPDWIGEEVTSDTRYFNSNLSKTPYSQWKDSLL